MSDSIKLGSVALECPDAGQLAAFYAEITGGTVTSTDAGWATVRCPGGDIDFQTAPGYQPPTWPDPSSSMQMHLDFLAAVWARLRPGCWRLARRSSMSRPVIPSGCMPTLPVTRSACASRARGCRSHSPSSGATSFRISGSGADDLGRGRWAPAGLADDLRRQAGVGTRARG